MQSPKDIRAMQAATRRQRALEAELDDARAEASGLAAALADAQRRVESALARLDTARQRGLEDAAGELAHRDRRLRVLTMQVRHLTGALRQRSDSYLDAATVDEVLAELTRIADEER